LVFFNGLLFSDFGFYGKQIGPMFGIEPDGCLPLAFPDFRLCFDATTCMLTDPYWNAVPGAYKVIGVFNPMLSAARSKV